MCKYNMTFPNHFFIDFKGEFFLFSIFFKFYKIKFSIWMNFKGIYITVIVTVESFKRNLRFSSSTIKLVFSSNFLKVTFKLSFLLVFPLKNYYISCITFSNHKNIQILF